jgi:hypothetical protein
LVIRCCDAETDKGERVGWCDTPGRVWGRRRSGKWMGNGEEGLKEMGGGNVKEGQYGFEKVVI